MSILVVGSVGLDTIETPAGKQEEILGGSAVHFSVSASHFHPVRMVGVVGDDFPEEHSRALAGRGIDLAGLQVVSGKTFRWSGRYEGDCNVAHTLKTELNVFGDFRPVIPPSWQTAEVVFLANIDPELQLHVLDQITSPGLVVSDTMNFWIHGKLDAVKEVVARSTVFLSNDQEARDITGCISLARASRSLLELGPRVVVIKKGEHGALMASQDGFFSAPGYPCERVNDPTGAGDSFAGGFVGYCAASGSLEHAHLKKAIVYGSVMGSLNVEAFGPSRLMNAERGDLDQRYREFFHLVSFEEQP